MQLPTLDLFNRHVGPVEQRANSGLPIQLGHTAYPSWSCYLRPHEGNTTQYTILAISWRRNPRAIYKHLKTDEPLVRKSDASLVERSPVGQNTNRFLV